MKMQLRFVWKTKKSVYLLWNKERDLDAVAGFSFLFFADHILRAAGEDMEKYPQYNFDIRS